MKKYIDMYLDLTPKNIEKISSYFENENYKALSLVIHSMKTHYNFMGMSSTRELANEIEELITDKKLRLSLSAHAAKDSLNYSEDIMTKETEAEYFKLI